MTLLSFLRSTVSAPSGSDSRDTEIEELTPAQAAMIVMETGTGKVRAVVGGVDFGTSQFDRAI